MTAITKGYQLDRLFRIARRISDEMRDIMKANNVNGCDLICLNEISPEDGSKWQDLHHKHNRVAELIGKVILSK